MHGLGSPRVSLAGDRRTSLRGFAAPRHYNAPHFLMLSSFAAAPSFGPPRAGEIRHSLGDPSRAQQELGFEARTDLRTGLAVTLDTL